MEKDNLKKLFSSAAQEAKQLTAEFIYGADYALETEGDFLRFTVRFFGDNAGGEIVIQSLELNLNSRGYYSGPMKFDPSTGYSTIKAVAVGEASIDDPKVFPADAEMTITIPPGFQTASLDLGGIFELHANATKIYTYLVGNLVG